MELANVTGHRRVKLTRFQEKRRKETGGGRGERYAKYCYIHIMLYNVHAEAGDTTASKPQELSRDTQVWQDTAVVNVAESTGV